MALAAAGNSFASFAATQTYGGLNGYWGQYSTDRLSDYCDTPGIQYLTLSFVNLAPEHSSSRYPGTNFAAHCGAGTYVNANGVSSSLLSGCETMKEDIPYCQSKGIKILLSIGGVYNTGASNYKVSSTANGVSFADFLYNSFGPYNASWTGPRPIDSDDGTIHNKVDGFDFDIEQPFNMDPYIAMAQQFRKRKGSILVTAAPQCPTSSKYFYLQKFVSTIQLSALFVQFYNNPACDAIAGNSPGDKFNYDDWATILSQTTKSKNTPIFVGLPGSPHAATNGFITASAVKSMVCKYHTHANWGGISVWDISYGNTYMIDGKPYNYWVLQALKYGCNTPPTVQAAVKVDKRDHHERRHIHHAAHHHN